MPHPQDQYSQRRATTNPQNVVRSKKVLKRNMKKMDVVNLSVITEMAPMP